MLIHIINLIVINYTQTFNDLLVIDSMRPTYYLLVNSVTQGNTLIETHEFQFPSTSSV